MAGYRSSACTEFDYSIIVARLIVDRLCSTVCGSDNLFSQLAIGIVVILNSINNNLRGYKLSGKLNICLGSPRYSAFLVLIIVALLSYKINRLYDITFAVIGIEKLRKLLTVCGVLL